MRGNYKKLENIFKSWGVEAFLSPGCIPSRIIEVSVSWVSKRLLMASTRSIQRELKELGWRLVKWKDEVPEEEFSLTSIRVIDEKLLPSEYYHLTEAKNIPGILERGLIPHRNYDIVCNPVPGVFLARTEEIAENVIPYRNGDKVFLKVFVHGIPLRPDPETLFHYEDEIDITYSCKRVPPERIRVLNSPWATLTVKTR